MSRYWIRGGTKASILRRGVEGLESRPTINLFEQWEESAHLPELVNARNYPFPKPLVVPKTWMYAPTALSLSDAVNNVSQHEERNTWSSITNQHGSRINCQLSESIGFHLE